MLPDDQARVSGARPTLVLPRGPTNHQKNATPATAAATCGSAGPQEHSRSAVTTTMATLSSVMVSISANATGQANARAHRARAARPRSGRLLSNLACPPASIAQPRRSSLAWAFSDGSLLPSHRAMKCLPARNEQGVEVGGHAQDQDAATNGRSPPPDHEREHDGKSSVAHRISDMRHALFVG